MNRKVKQLNGDFSRRDANIHYLHNPMIHLYYPPRLLHNHCLQFLLGHENVPREVENNAYADFFFFFFLGGGGGGR